MNCGHPKSSQGRVRRGSAEPVERPADANGRYTAQAGAKGQAPEHEAGEARVRIFNPRIALALSQFAFSLRPHSRPKP